MNSKPGESHQSLIEDPILKAIPEVRGYKVLGPCVLRRLLGRGGMGSVYQSQHLNLGIEVAVKCLHPGVINGSEELASRFRREAVLAATTSHTHLVRVFDVGEAAGVVYLVMELVQGETLRGRVKRRGGRLSLQESLSLILQAAEGLGAAHRAGIIHRDIKPDNILVSASGTVKVADLGLAKSDQRADSVATSSRLVMGTPQYMPPEQFEGAIHVTAASDVYSLGLTLAFLLLGRDIFEGSITEVMRQVCVQEFPDLETLLHGIPPEVIDLILGAVARDAKHRPADAQVFAREVAALLDHHGGAVELGDVGAAPSDPSRSLISPLPASVLNEIKQHQEKSPPTWVLPGEPPMTLDIQPRTSSTRRIASAAVLLLLCAAGGIAFLRMQPQTAPEGNKPSELALVREKLADPVLRTSATERLWDYYETHPEDTEAKALLVHQYRSQLEDLESQESFSDALFLARRLALVQDSERHRTDAQRLEKRVRERITESIQFNQEMPTFSASNRVTISGSVNYPGAVKAEIAGRETPLAGGAYRAEVDLADGPHDVVARIRDRNNVSGEKTRKVIVDTLPPSIQFLSPAPGEVVGAQFTLQVQVTEANETVVTFEGEPQGVAATNGSPIVRALTRKGGAHEIRVAARDAAGNQATATLSILVDDVPPVLTAEVVASGQAVRESEVRIVGSARDGSAAARLKIGETLVAVGDDGHFDLNLPLLQDGQHHFVLVASDSAGNESRTEVSILRDSTPPVITLTGAAAGAPRLRPGSQQLQLSVVDDHPCTVLHQGKEIPIIDGRATLHVDLRQTGRQDVIVTARDSLGNHAEHALGILVLRPCHSCSTSGNCISCKGAGSQTHICGTCSNTRTVREGCSTCSGTGGTRCNPCRGTGRGAVPCNTCGGNGDVDCPNLPWHLVGGVINIFEKKATTRCNTCGNKNKVRCGTCRGKKRVEGACIHCVNGVSTAIPCGTCSGQRSVAVACRACSHRASTTTCTPCQGKGKCQTCKGDGYIDP